MGQYCSVFVKIIAVCTPIVLWNGMWLDLQKPSQIAQELKSNLWLNIKTTL